MCESYTNYVRIFMCYYYIFILLSIILILFPYNSHTNLRAENTLIYVRISVSPFSVINHLLFVVSNNLSLRNLTNKRVI